MRKTEFVNGEFYHVFNRGTDKRVIFPERYDFQRFFQGMELFNVLDPIGSIYENSFRKNIQLGNLVSKLELGTKQPQKLVNFICYCLNPNHYHFILQQLVDRGIEKFMHRLGVGFVKYFNQKYQRSGVLFQGPFKAVHVDSNEYLLHLSAYVNLNYKVHRLGNQVSKSSWDEYAGVLRENEKGFCEKDVILCQFNTVSEYKEFAEDSLEKIRERKDLEHLLFGDDEPGLGNQVSK